MSDLIDRQAAIDYVDDVPYIKEHPNIGLLWKAWLDQLPSAQPERKTGRWIVEWETEDTRMLRCSECRMVFNVGTGRDGNYCPNCGARMEEDDAD